MFEDIQKDFNITLNHKEDGETFRSWFKRARKSLDPLYTSQPPNSPSLLTDEKMALQAERVLLRDQKNALNKSIREQARFEYLQESMLLAADIVAKEKPLEWNGQIAMSGHKEAALLLGDWHVGLEVDNFMNKYNVEICRQRLAQLVVKVIQYAREHRLRKIHVFDVGDNIAGSIHVAVRAACNEDVISQVMIASELFAEVIAFLANEIPEVLVYSVTDNHSRILPNKNDVVQKESYARLIPWYLKPRLEKFKNVKVMDTVLDYEIAIADIMGQTIFAVHGHRDQVSNVVPNLALMTKKFPDCVFLGHYHHSVEDEIHGCDVVVNPSLVGVEEHAKGLRKSSKPAQKLIIFNEHGRECTYSINLK